MDKQFQSSRLPARESTHLFDKSSRLEDYRLAEIFKATTTNIESENGNRKQEYPASGKVTGCDFWKSS